MKKLILSILTIGSFGLYVLSQNGNSPSDIVAQAPVPVSNSDTASPKTYPVKTPTSAKTVPVKTSPAPAPVIKKTGQYSDGSYVGSLANAYYGYVQVKAVITNGRISDVQFLDYPQDRSTSRYINSQAMPYLRQEAISAQSANVDGVSGASDTSMAFRQSLSVALSKARA